MINKIRNILDTLNINYDWYNHKTIITLQDPIEVDEELNLVGEETKNKSIDLKKVFENVENKIIYVSLLSD